MPSSKLRANAVFPKIIVQSLDGTEVDLSQRAADNWKMVVVYRGVHCPLCTQFLNKLQTYVERLQKVNIDLVAVSGDSEAQLQKHLPELKIDFPIYFGLSIEQMQTLGLYISHPRSEKETDHPFPEPGLFVINSDGTVHIIDISNAPILRPDLEVLVAGLEFVRANDYPIRGTYE